MYIDNIASNGVTLNSAGKSFQIEIYEKIIKNLQEENKKLKSAIQDTYDSANDICGELQQKIDKTLKDTEELYKMAKEQDSENVNLIDRLENILKTLKGE